MENQKYFIIGGGYQQLKFIQRLKERNFITYVFDGNENAPSKDIADYFYNIDIKNRKRIFEIAKESRPIAVQAVITELGNITACWIGENLGLRNNSYETALNTTDKIRMKKILETNKISTPLSYPVSSLQDVRETGLTYPFLIKAPDSSASRGVSFVQKEDEIEPALRKAFKFTNKPLVLAEEFINGKELAIETITADGKHNIVGITELQLETPPYIMLSSRKMPVYLSDEEKSLVTEFSLKILDTFQIKHGACHIEIFLKDKKCFLIEIASRLGGWRDMMIKESTGVDYIDLIINESLGLPLDLTRKKQRSILLRSVLNSKDYEKYEHIKKLFPHMIIEDKVEPPLYTNYQATNLIESLGYYCISAENDEEMKFFEKRYE